MSAVADKNKHISFQNFIPPDVSAFPYAAWYEVCTLKEASDVGEWAWQRTAANEGIEQRSSVPKKSSKREIACISHVWNIADCCSDQERQREGIDAPQHREQKQSAGLRQSRHAFSQHAQSEKKKWYCLPPCSTRVGNGREGCLLV